MSDDAQHLQLLSIFHYVVGGVAVLYGCFPLLYVAVGVAIISDAFDNPKQEAPPLIFGWLAVFVGMAISLVAWAFAACLILAGLKLARRTSYTFCFVVACIECCFTPFGTVLGVFTIIVLLRPSVKALFGQLPGPPMVEPI